MIVAAVVMTLALANDPRWSSASDLTPVVVGDITDNDSGKVTTLLLCIDYSVWPVDGTPNDPRVKAWKCPASVVGHRRRSVPHESIEKN